MPQFTVTAFKWSGTGYNSQYDESYTATIEDDDSVYEGRSDNNESVSIDGGPFSSTAGPGYTIDVSFTDVEGTPHVETFNFFNTDGSWYFVPGPESEFSVGSTLGTYQSHSSDGWKYGDVACFVEGTLIETIHGAIPVEGLRPGVSVLTLDGTFEPLRLNMNRRIHRREVGKNSKLLPVRVVAGALGNGLPKRDLLVSRQHRMLLSSKICQRMFGRGEALVAAIRLTELPGVFVEPQSSSIVYHHLVFDSHKVIFAEGAPTESFLLGPDALRLMSVEAIEEIQTIFPKIQGVGFNPTPARYIPSRKLQKKLVARHVKNNQQVI